VSRKTYQQRVLGALGPGRPRPKADTSWEPGRPLATQVKALVVSISKVREGTHMKGRKGCSSDMESPPHQLKDSPVRNVVANKKLAGPS
jgi:hypothetical protein